MTSGMLEASLQRCVSKLETSGLRQVTESLHPPCLARNHPSFRPEGLANGSLLHDSGNQCLFGRFMAFCLKIGTFSHFFNEQISISRFSEFVKPRTKWGYLRSILAHGDAIFMTNWSKLITGFRSGSIGKMAQQSEVALDKPKLGVQARAW